MDEAKRQAKLEKERERIEALCEFEKEYDYCQYICGIDEVRRSAMSCMRLYPEKL